MKFECLSRFWSFARTLRELQARSILRVCLYRIQLKLGRLANISRASPVFLGHFLAMDPVRQIESSAFSVKQSIFGWHMAVFQMPPNWAGSPLSVAASYSIDQPWFKALETVDPKYDVKEIWELSRFYWAPMLAEQIVQGDLAAKVTLNNWLRDWTLGNPPFCGVNWACGQEAAIRVLQCSQMALITGEVRQATTTLTTFLGIHLQRISSTLHYAIGQDNNHGLSEAAALFVGGSWLADRGVSEGRSWMRIGRRWLEDRVTRLIGFQGSFCMYSSNYQRMALDTLCIVEVWRRHLSLPEFSLQWRTLALAATQWLRHMINEFNGEGPNVGANDGSRLLNLSASAHRDFRPSVQLAMALFANCRAYALVGPWNGPLQRLGVPLPQAEAPSVRNYVADDGGFVMLRRGIAMVMMRYPRFRFRPSQADALHVDLWLRGENLLRDAGTYSYSTEPQWLRYFGGTASHNTVQFDDRDQMPRLSRFLLGEWLKTKWLQPLVEDVQGAHFAAGYRDSKGACHRRRICLGNELLSVEDDVAGFDHKAVLRWRLLPGAWQLERAGDELRVFNMDENSAILTLRVSAPIVRCELVQGWESCHYLEKTPVPVLELEIQKPGSFRTEVRWSV